MKLFYVVFVLFFSLCGSDVSQEEQLKQIKNNATQIATKAVEISAKVDQFFANKDEIKTIQQIRDNYNILCKKYNNIDPDLQLEIDNDSFFHIEGNIRKMNKALLVYNLKYREAYRARLQSNSLLGMLVGESNLFDKEINVSNKYDDIADFMEILMSVYRTNQNSFSIRSNYNTPESFQFCPFGIRHSEEKDKVALPGPTKAKSIFEEFESVKNILEQQCDDLARKLLEDDIAKDIYIDTENPLIVTKKFNVFSDNQTAESARYRQLWYLFFGLSWLILFGYSMFMYQKHGLQRQV